VAVALIAFLSHVPNLRQNLPYSIYPDEQRVLGRGLLMFRDGTWDPEEYLYPSVSINLQRIWAEVSFPLARAQGRISDPSEIQWSTHRHVVHPELVVWGRGLVAGLGALGIWLAYWTATRLRDRWAGLAAAALLASNGFYWTHSVIASADSAAAFTSLLWAWGLLFFLARPSMGRVVLLGVMAGLVASSKYNAAAAAVASIPAVWLAGSKPLGKPWRACAWLVLGCALGFVVGTPMALVKPDAIIATAFSQLDIYTQSGHLPEATVASSWAKAWHDLGFLTQAFVVAPMAALFFPLLGWRAWRHGWRDPYVLLMSYPALFIVIMLNTLLLYDRNYALIMPFFAIAAGYWLSQLGEALDRRRPASSQRNPSAAWLALAVVVILMVPELLALPERLSEPARPDTRTLAANALRNEVLPQLAAGERIAVLTGLEMHPTDLEALAERVVPMSFHEITRASLRAQGIRFVLTGLPWEGSIHRQVALLMWNSGDVVFAADGTLLPMGHRPIRDPRVRVLLLD
jgi:MFS family permease